MAEAEIKIYYLQITQFLLQKAGTNYRTSRTTRFREIK